jgi:uncharacterized lipoprotein YmbA
MGYDVSTHHRSNRRQMTLALLGATSALLWGCGGSDGDEEDTGQPLYQAFNDLRGGMSPEQVRRTVPLDPVSSPSANPLVWETARERLEVSFQGGVIVSARWTDRQTGRTYLRTFRVTGGGAGGRPGTLYDAYLALRPGMTRAQVVRLVPVAVSQGGSTSQLLWVEGVEALGVRFDGSTDGSTITFAQWGLSIPAGGRDESRTF